MGVSPNAFASQNKRAMVPRRPGTKDKQNLSGIQSASNHNGGGRISGRNSTNNNNTGGRYSGRNSTNNGRQTAKSADSDPRSKRSRTSKNNEMINSS